MNRDDIIRMAREAGIVWGDHTVVGGQENLLEAFAALVAAHEREVCATMADLVAREIDDTNGIATYIAAAIRARGQA